MKQLINTLRVNERNPRNITSKKLELLVDSILSFPKMLSLRPIVVDDNNVVLGGNMRTRALNQIADMDISLITERLEINRDYQKMPEAAQKELCDYWGKWLKKKEVEVVKASELSEQEKKRFIIEDNASFGSWDYDMLANDWDNADLNDWGVDVWESNEDGNVELREDGAVKETSQFIHSFKVGNITVQMTDEEFELLSQKVDEYIETYQNTFGFINWLCNGTDKA